MLLPALSKAREKAKSIKCTNNLKQIGLAIFQYTDDYSGWLPPHRSGASGTPRWYEILCSGNYLPENACDSSVNSEQRVLRCPSEPDVKQARDYSNNEYIMGLPTQPATYWLKLSMMTSPAKTGMIVDGSAFTYGWKSRPDNEKYGPDWPRHNYGVNMLFTDGHVSWLNLTTFSTEYYASTFWPKLY
jgi:prepilin-type processing-associated H-X9-DG protein